MQSPVRAQTHGGDTRILGCLSCWQLMNTPSILLRLQQKTIHAPCAGGWDFWALASVGLDIGKGFRRPFGFALRGAAKLCPWRLAGDSLQNDALRNISANTKIAQGLRHEIGG